MDFTNGSALSVALTFTAWFIVFYYYHATGITLGYHRLLTHKALKVPNWLMYTIVSGGYLVLMGGPVNWVGVHRLHHQKSDMPEDPHSPLHGFKHALYGWMFTMGDRQTNNELRKQVPDLLQNKVLCWFGIDHTPEQAQLCLAVSILFRFVILGLFGWTALLANLAATFLVFWSPQLVNAVCHQRTAGYRLFETRDESRNVPWVAIMSLGEGWHNNHHAIPRSARHGMAWWEVDVTWLTIAFLEKVGLAKEVVRPKYPPNSKLALMQSAGKQPKPSAGEATVEEEGAVVGIHTDKDGAPIAGTAATAKPAAASAAAVVEEKPLVGVAD